MLVCGESERQILPRAKKTFLGCASPYDFTPTGLDFATGQTFQLHLSLSIWKIWTVFVSGAQIRLTIFLYGVLYRVFYVKSTLVIFTYPQHWMQRLKIIAMKSFLQKPDENRKLYITHSKNVQQQVKQNNYVIKYISYTWSNFINIY